MVDQVFIVRFKQLLNGRILIILKKKEKNDAIYPQWWMDTNNWKG